ncbi:MAG: serine/threonine-protein kinase [Candidatus Aminicenantes bacterium]|nr:MAG: serine/threonine-protein kinase [Candidatus Aminicenantes bacterium]
MAVKITKPSSENPDRAAFTRTLQTPVGLPFAGATLAGKYRILEEIGRGGMGVVYKAEDTQLKRTVALKFLSPDSTAVPSREKRFAQEAQNASALNHPNICTIYEVGEAERNSFIAMEYVDGRPLDRMIPDGGLPPNDILRYGSQIVEAFEHAHEKGVIHRDLKTANVMITPAGRVKVLDFGLAKRLVAEELGEATRSQFSLTEEGMIAGTPAYMAPETLQGHPADARSDIWAMGVVLYEMAAGTRPFEGRTGFELTSAILRDAPAPLPVRTAAGLSAVIRKCLEKDLEKRFQTVSEVRAALETNVLAKSSEASGPASMIRSRRGRWVLAGVALCVAGALIFTLAPRGGEKPGTAKDRGAFLSTGARRSPVAEANEYFERGMLFLKAQFNLASARKMLERALELDPKFAEARGWYGFTFILEIDSGHSSDSSWLYKAEQELRRALQDDPDSASAHSSLAALYFFQGRKDLIPDEANKALALNPDGPDAKIWLFNYYAMSGEYAIAKEYINQLLESDPLFFPARMNLADILRLEGDLAGAIRESGKILEQDPRNPFAAKLLARTYIDGNDLPMARRSLESLSPDDQRGNESKLIWALLLALEGKTKEALAKMDEDSLKFGALSPWATSMVAEFYAVMGDPQKSLDWLETAVRNGDERDAWFRSDPSLAKVRDLPRFQQIIDSIEFRRKSRIGGKTNHD